MSRFSVSAASRWMILAVGQFAGERDLVDARMLDERGAGRRAVAGHDVDHAVRECRPSAPAAPSAGR